MLTNFIIWSLICYSITNVITQSSLFDPIRKYIEQKNKHIGKLFKCPMCMGFWIGILLSFIWFSPSNLIDFNMSNIPYCILDGFLSSAISWLLFCHSTGYCLLRPEQVELDLEARRKAGCSNCSG